MIFTDTARWENRPLRKTGPAKNYGRRPFRRLWLILLALAGFGCNQALSRREAADELAAQGKYEQAIAAYREHMEERLNERTRPDWENPYLYLLDIGDVYLLQGEPEDALKYYELAGTKGVEQTYVNDRIRQTAKWYEERGEFSSALALLRRYRHEDPLIFDLMLDRIAKAMVAAEEGTFPKDPKSGSAAAAR